MHSILSKFILILTIMGLFSFNAHAQQEPDFDYPQQVSKDALAQLKKAQRSGDGQMMVDALVRFSIAKGKVSQESVDTVIMRIMDMMLAIPSILLAITFMAAFGRGFEKAVVAIGLVSIPEYARIVRSQILSVKENDYVAAARVVGDSDAKIILHHVLPNVMPSIIVRATLGISSAILDCAALGFLGLGVQPPAAEWGDMLGRGRSYIFSAPYLMLFPGLAITLTVLAFNLLGDGIRDAFDPKSRRR